MFLIPLTLKNIHSLGTFCHGSYIINERAEMNVGLKHFREAEVKLKRGSLAGELFNNYSCTFYVKGQNTHFS